MHCTHVHTHTCTGTHGPLLKGPAQPRSTQQSSGKKGCHLDQTPAPQEEEANPEGSKRQGQWKQGRAPVELPSSRQSRGPSAPWSVDLLSDQAWGQSPRAVALGVGSQAERLL